MFHKITQEQQRCHKKKKLQQKNKFIAVRVLNDTRQV
jgi:hypothetical protein